MLFGRNFHAKPATLPQTAWLSGDHCVSRCSSDLARSLQPAGPFTVNGSSTPVSILQIDLIHAASSIGHTWPVQEELKIATLALADFLCCCWILEWTVIATVFATGIWKSSKVTRCL